MKNAIDTKSCDLLGMCFLGDEHEARYLGLVQDYGLLTKILFSPAILAPQYIKHRMKLS